MGGKSDALWDRENSQFIIIYTDGGPLYKKVTGQTQLPLNDRNMSCFKLKVVLHAFLKNNNFRTFLTIAKYNKFRGVLEESRRFSLKT